MSQVAALEAAEGEFGNRLATFDWGSYINEEKAESAVRRPLPSREPDLNSQPRARTQA
jgi:hypothetical protein